MKRSPSTSLHRRRSLASALSLFAFGWAILPVLAAAQELAPESVADMFYIVAVKEPQFTGGNPPPVEQLPHAAVLSRDGTRTRLDVSVQLGQLAPATYAWTKTSAKTAILRLTGSDIVSRLEITFTSPGRATYREIREGRSVISSGDFLIAPVPRNLTPPLINLSSRLTLSAGQTAIQGFVVEGPAPRRVLVRAVGPTLAAFGVQNVAATPTLSVFKGATQIASNTGWAGAANLSAAFVAAGAFALPSTSRDSAVVLTLEPGDYTAQARDANGGEVLLEVYLLN
ncbi:MAG: hypothetical protein HZA93_16150 [Verrucomicrobia bacterium]|nr:hypothetical protein [Verrucomicrobiota bacterium]